MKENQGKVPSSKVEEHLPPRYAMIRLLGEGGLGKVFLVEDHLRKERLALKLLTGMESASPKILQLMRKPTNIAHTAKILRICHQNQIKSTLYFLIGFPNETDEDFQKTLDFLETNSLYIYDILASVFTLMPKSPIFSMNLLTPIQLEPFILNAYTYQTTDGVTHEIRTNRFLQIHDVWHTQNESLIASNTHSNRAFTDD